MRSKQLLFISGFLLLLLYAPAQIKISLTGKIIDSKTGMTLPGASIYLSDLRLGTLADDKGVYSFNKIPAGHHLIEISHTGYASIVEHIDIDREMIRDFSLQQSVVENKGVIVTGVASATSLRKTSVPISIIRKTDLLHAGGNNIIDALTKQPGISQVQTGPGISKPVIRGLGYNRVVVINDGVRQEGQQWGDEHGIEIDEANVNKVEILKGPASLIYGSDAMAGVINFLSNVPVA